MTQLLEDLFWGNIRPNETCHVDFRLSEKTKKHSLLTKKSYCSF